MITFMGLIVAAVLKYLGITHIRSAGSSSCYYGAATCRYFIKNFLKDCRLNSFT